MIERRPTDQSHIKLGSSVLLCFALAAGTAASSVGVPAAGALLPDRTEEFQPVTPQGPTEPTTPTTPTTPPPSEPSPLAGPKVSKPARPGGKNVKDVTDAAAMGDAMQAPMLGTSEEESLVVKSFYGEIELPKPTAEEAALGLLTISEAEKAATMKVLGSRRRILDDFVGSNTDLLTKLGVAAGTGDKTDQGNLLIEAAAELRALWAKGALQDQLRDCLSQANAKRFDRLLSKFWTEYSRAKMLVKKEDGNLPNKFEVMTGAKLESLGKEIEAAFGQMLTSGSLLYKLFFDGVPLDADQRAELPELVETFTRDTEGESDEVRFPRLVGLIMPKLKTDEQRRTFLGNIGRLSRGDLTKKKPATPQSPAR